MGDDADEWDDPPLPGEEPAPAVEWPTNGVESAAWGGWLALAYALVAGGRALAAGTLPLRPALVGLLGAGLLLGVWLAGDDPRVWR
jgi:hypothetical protein